MTKNTDVPIESVFPPRPTIVGTVKVVEAQPPTAEFRNTGPVEVAPISWDAVYDADAGKDFRPVQIPVEEADPKALPAAESAGYFDPESDLIPTLDDPESPSPLENLAKFVSAEKVKLEDQGPAFLKPPSL